MFETLFNKLSDLGHHHQILFTIIVTLSFICISWAIGKILDEHIFARKRLYDYLLVVLLGALLLWITQHIILHAI